jgi:histidinol-phosphate aminotransferase
MKPDPLMRNTVRDLRRPIYPSAQTEGLRLDGNTNVVSVNPILEDLAGSLENLELNFYPTPSSDLLRSALARRHNLSPDQFLVGNGSDEVIDLICKTFLNPGDTVCAVRPSFVMYPFYTRTNGANYHAVPFGPGMTWPVDDLLAAEPKLIFVASPNNPTGNTLPEEQLVLLAKGLKDKGVVVLDEAYVEFADRSLHDTAMRFDNVLVLRTFSKAFGLAGIRVGYAYGSKEFVHALYAVKPPYNLNSISEKAATLALRDEVFVQNTIRIIREQRERMSQELQERRFIVYPSQANFLLVEPETDAEALFESLRRRNVFVRLISGSGDRPDRIRITLGPGEMMTEFLRILDEVLE